MLLNCARVGGKNRSATFSCEKAGTHSQLGHAQHICIVVDRQGRVAFLEDGNSRRGVRLRGPHALPSTCDCLTSEAWSEPPSSAIYTNVWGLFDLFRALLSHLWRLRIRKPILRRTSRGKERCRSGSAAIGGRGQWGDHSSAAGKSNR